MAAITVTAAQYINIKPIIPKSGYAVYREDGSARIIEFATIYGDDFLQLRITFDGATDRPTVANFLLDFPDAVRVQNMSNI